MASPGVTPKQIYTALINAGASTTQAIGIMANMINESNLSPEAVQSGVSDPGYGLVQWENSSYPNASSLVTGNPSADLASQVKFLAQTGGFKAASGSTAAAAAGNFAANYEHCDGCQAGGPQYNSRVANAATVAGWVSSGNWPTAASPGGLTGGTTSTSTATASAACLVGFNGVSVPVLGSLGQACFVSKSEARAIIGGMLLAGSAFGALVGLLILAAAGFRMSGAGHAAGGALEGAGAAVAFVPGAEGAGIALGAAGATARRAGSSNAGRRSLDRRQARRSEAARANVKTAQPARAARPASSAPPAPAAPGPKVRTGRGQVSQDWAARYGTA